MLHRPPTSGAVPALYRRWRGASLSTATGVLLIALGCAGCSFRMGETYAAMKDDDVTGSITPVAQREDVPTESDLAFARTAASDVLTRGGRDASQPWENPKTGARGSVTPLASAYTSEGRICRDFLASYVRGQSETWLQGEACRGEKGRWEIRALRPWKRS